MTSAYPPFLHRLLTVAHKREVTSVIDFRLKPVLLFMPFLPEQNRHKEESDHIIQKMRNKADQAVAGPAVQYRKSQEEIQ